MCLHVLPPSPLCSLLSGASGPGIQSQISPETQEPFLKRGPFWLLFSNRLAIPHKYSMVLFTVGLECSDIFQYDFIMLKAFQYTVTIFLSLFPEQISVTPWKSLIRISEHWIKTPKHAYLWWLFIWVPNSSTSMGNLVFPFFSNSISPILYYRGS